MINIFFKQKSTSVRVVFSGFDYTDLSNHLVGTLDEYLLWPPVALCHVIQEPLYNNKTLVKLHKYQCITCTHAVMNSMNLKSCQMWKYLLYEHFCNLSMKI